jgi:hypothetical protein
LESSINSNTITTSERNRQLIDRFLQSIKSDVTRRNALDYIHIYMRYWHLYEEKKEGEWGGRRRRKRRILLTAILTIQPTKTSQKEKYCR